MRQVEEPSELEELAWYDSYHIGRTEDGRDVYARFHPSQTKELILGFLMAQAGAVRAYRGAARLVAPDGTPLV